MRWTQSLLGMSVVLALAWGLAWAGDPVPMFGDYKTLTPLVPLKRGAFKIAENESPRPQDRLYLNYNFYNNVKRDLTTGTEDVHRETIGVEKTVLGDASIGERLPFFQGIDGNDFEVGDLSFVLKYAPIHNRETGNALSLGLVVTVPTGPIPNRFVARENRNVHPALFQPFVGYLWNQGDLFLHAFHSIMVPTDSDDVTMLFNDIAVGYWLYRGKGEQLLTGVIPTFEVHVNTPLNHRPPGDLQVYRDIVNLTAGAHLEFKRRYLLGIALATPVTNPRPFDFEVIANFNYRF